MPFLLVSSGTSRRRPVIVRTTPVARASASVWSMKARTRGEAGEVGVDELLRRLLRHADVLRQRERGLSVEQRVVDDLRAPPQLVRVEPAVRAEHALGRAVVNVDALRETPRRAPRRPRDARARAARSASSRRRSARSPGSATNARADLAAERRADRDVLQVRIAAAQPAGRGHRLVERRVHAAGRRIARAPAARRRTCPSASGCSRHFSTRPGSSCVERQLLEHVLRRRDDARLAGLLRRLQIQLAEQHVGELLRRVDVELARRRVRRSAGTSSSSSRCIVAAEHRERRRVDADAGALDVRQHRNERLLELAVDATSRPSRFEVVVERRRERRAAGRRARRRTSRSDAAGTASSATAFDALAGDVLFGHARGSSARSSARPSIAWLDRVASSR